MNGTEQEWLESFFLGAHLIEIEVARRSAALAPAAEAPVVPSIRAAQQHAQECPDMAVCTRAPTHDCRAQTLSTNTGFILKTDYAHFTMGGQL